MAKHIKFLSMKLTITDTILPELKSESPCYFQSSINQILVVKKAADSYTWAKPQK